jgi:hypothetical protein
MHQRAQVFCGVLVACLGVSVNASAGTYYIDENQDFTGNGCGNLADLNNVSSSLKSGLDARGWTGSRYTESLAWPQDFWESCSTSFGTGGLDSTYADTKLLSVYAGHGDTGKLSWGWPHNGQCSSFLVNNMRLGSMNGTQSAFGMWMTSCTMKKDSGVYGLAWQRQQFGFHNSPSIQDTASGYWLSCQHVAFGGDNTGCWADAMKVDQNGDYDNSPVIVSFGATPEEATSVRDTADLYDNIYTSPRGGGPSCGAGQPLYWFIYTWVNNGSTPSCS